MEHCTTTKRHGFAALTITALALGSGCCAQQLCEVPDDIAAAVYGFNPAHLIHNACSNEPLPGCASGVGSSWQVENDDTTDLEEVFENSPLPVYECVAQRLHAEVGPPPVSYNPPMPPEFLPVPTQPVFSMAHTLAPTSTHETFDFDSHVDTP